MKEQQIMHIHNNKTRQPLTKGVARVPLVMQLEALECGAASLAMIAAYYHKWIPLEQVRMDCGVSRDGSNAANMMRAAKNYGFNVKAFRYEPQDLREKGYFPCIIHWNFNHFVVLNGFRGNKVYLNDPARGTVAVSMEEFDRSFTGICLLFQPNDDFQPEGKRQSTLSFAAKRLTGAKTAILFVVLTSLISYLFGIINPVMTRVFVDRLLTGINLEWLSPFIGLMVFLAILQIIVCWIQAIYSLKINGKMAVIGNTSYMWKLLRLPMDFFFQRMAGDLQQRQETNATIAKTLVNTLAPLFLNTFMMIFYLILMLRYNVAMTAVGILTILLNLLMSRYISAKRINIMRVQMRDSGKLASETINGIKMIETIKASGAENGFFQRWAGYQASANEESVKFPRLNEYLGFIPAFLNTAAGYIVLIMGIWAAMQGNFTVGMLLTFQGFLSSFMAPAGTLISAGQTLQEMRTQMERVEDVMQYPEDVHFRDEEVHEDTDYKKLSGYIELQNVTFGYSRLAPPLIRDFSMTLKPGSRVALVGTSGCGKSTLSKLVSGLYTPWSGKILFDGKPITAIDRSVFTGSVAVVDQDIILFEDTIANNIKMWDSSIEDFEMILAARDAQIHNTILQREGDYQYQLTEGGRNLSGGQRQCLEIARVLAQDPSVIILDEATSALDAKTEYDVVNAIKDRGVTCIVIAHRLSTIRDCDEIIVLDKGCVVERGTHEELYKKGGYYADLVSNE